MISPFSRLIDYGVETQFRKDSSGRTVFLPFGPRKKAYFVDSKADEAKIRSFLKMYRGASALISWLGMLAIYVFGWSSTHHAGPGAIPVWTRLTPFIVSSLVYLLIMILWAWMLWGIYKEAVSDLTSSLSEVGPDIGSQLTNIPSRRGLALLCLFAGLIVLGAGLLVAARYSPRPCPAKGKSTSWRKGNCDHRSDSFCLPENVLTSNEQYHIDHSVA
jgi:hypothetical protein